MVSDIGLHGLPVTFFYRFLGKNGLNRVLAVLKWKYDYGNEWMKYCKKSKNETFEIITMINLNWNGLVVGALITLTISFPSSPIVSYPNCDGSLSFYNLPSGHLVPKLRRIDVDATKSRRIDVNTT